MFYPILLPSTALKPNLHTWQTLDKDDKIVIAYGGIALKEVTFVRLSPRHHCALVKFERPILGEGRFTEEWVRTTTEIVDIITKKPQGQNKYA